MDNLIENTPKTDSIPIPLLLKTPPPRQAPPPMHPQKHQKSERISVPAHQEVSSPSATQLGDNLRRRHRKSMIYRAMVTASVGAGIFLLVFLLTGIITDGYENLSWKFLSNFPSRFPAKAGVLSAIMGSLWVIGFTAMLSVPIGIGAAIYLEEYAKPGKFSKFIEINIGNLAGVPSIIYGLLGLVVFVRTIGMDRSVLAGATTLSLLILPIIIVASREALRSVPQNVRHASYALGATRWQTIWAHVLPASLPGILTGVILSLSRAIGETAPLVMVGAVAYVAFVPDGPGSAFTVMPIQIFDWASRPQEAFHSLAATAIIVLLAVMLAMNAVAILLRNRAQRRIKW